MAKKDKKPKKQQAASSMKATAQENTNPGQGQPQQAPSTADRTSKQASNLLGASGGMFDLLEKLKEQSKDTAQMAEVYLRQGLLNEHRAALAMKEKIDSSLLAAEAKFKAVFGSSFTGGVVEQKEKVVGAEGASLKAPNSNEETSSTCSGGGAVSSNKSSAADHLENSTRSAVGASAAGAGKDAIAKDAAAPGPARPRATSADAAGERGSAGGREGMKSSGEDGSSSADDFVTMIENQETRPEFSSATCSYRWRSDDAGLVLEVVSKTCPDVDLSPDWLRIAVPGAADEDGATNTKLLTLPNMMTAVLSSAATSPSCSAAGQQAGPTLSRKKKTSTLRILFPFSSDERRSQICASKKLLMIPRFPVPSLQCAELLRQTGTNGNVAGLAGDYGFGTVDGFVAPAVADLLREQILSLWRSHKLDPGEIEGTTTKADDESTKASKARSDDYTYLDEQENDFLREYFTLPLDRLLLELTDGSIPGLQGKKLMRGRPMVTVYAGEGSRYTPHFDCVQGDNGRVCTCILYLNPFWKGTAGAAGGGGAGGALHIYPTARRRLEPTGECCRVEPLHARLVVFLCDSRNLHEVVPMTEGEEPRVAVSCWYYDTERVREMDHTGDSSCRAADMK